MLENEEALLVDQARAGSRKAFEEILGSYYSRIYSTAYQWLGSKADAEEVSQEACIKIGQSIQGFEGRSKFSSWVYRIVVNLCKDRFKQTKPHEQLEAAQIDEHEISDETQAPVELINKYQLWQRVHQLPINQREAVLLVYGEGLNHAEASERLACAEGTVSWYIAEAKKNLSKRLDPDD